VSRHLRLYQPPTHLLDYESVASQPSGTTVRIALTPGEPAGVGPDLCLQLAMQERRVELVAICDPALLQARAETLRMPVTCRPLDKVTERATTRARELSVLPVPLRVPAVCGCPDPANARYVLDTLDLAVNGCLNGAFSAMVTGPVHKAVINEAGIPFRGHTEYLAAATRTREVVMLLAAPRLRVALATTHVPLSEVSRLITVPRLTVVLRILHEGLHSDFGIARPVIGVCGLNPHAGEGGHLGREEIDCIEPALQALRSEGMQLLGPLPADSAFTPDHLRRIDAMLAMYHDQGLPVLKHLGFGRAVNITLGLPIIRTSVDHGTALELAGTGRADVGSLRAALQTAIEIARLRTRG
jgi:4-hydroxythreonine-4-phosphate dehydrogenase